ncbi:helix-turn-helix domain-containing protein [Chitinophaga nivalis]|uniref:Helix-turn-helix transcriptional regulator n=1 Tax=Chitinophaga nivalis TaxID=2991709 RepID=A0ABT3IMI6_9BACT|nr:AraC family transcriptional regulator [Chitinophaga nivalis]MCW3465146.1 helix-turn-helix transcriptional regulator [Chitinophaga nivalis]MCW3485162.1 helix-turn-helix transcriptional regulator [Chitinophaga nivalis]
MAKGTVSLEQFYQDKYGGLPEDLQKNIGQFNVFRIEDRLRTGTTSPTFIRRDFFKIMLFQGDNIFHYGNTSIPISGHTLLFFNPRTPYTYEPLTADTSGYFCVFKDEFFKENLRLNLSQLPLFTAGAQPVFSLDDANTNELKSIFEKMLREFDTDYLYKYELIRNYVSELIYLAMKFQPVSSSFEHPNAAARVTAVFTELLERQFPIDSTSQRFELRSPKAFAERLSIHVNYLNRAIRQTTGHTTTELIFARITAEAKALLRHTNWNIAEIGYVLGFEDQAHFHHFFKKQTTLSPSDFRQV